MQQTLNVANLHASSGERRSAIITTKISDVEVNLPIFLINGSHPGPTFVLIAGIHGGEYPCVEAASRLGQALDPLDLHGQIIIVPSANPIAFAARSIYITPVDNKNLNRVFPGDPKGTFTEAWAAWLFEHIFRKADFFLDMHGGDLIEALVPFTSYNVTSKPEIDALAKKMALAFGIRAILVKEDAGGLAGSTYAAAARAGIPALMAEAGGQGLLDEASVNILQSGVRRTLAALDMYPSIEEVGESPEIFTNWSWLTSEVDGLYYPAVEVGDHVKTGANIGYIADFFGNKLQSLTSPVDGEILFLVTSLAMNTGDPIMAIAYH